ncbi:MAG: NAD-dependent epimerase/dehydratase family protein [Flavobacteriaceae bacterium]
MILVTGGTGMLGAYLLHSLSKKKHQVIATYRRIESLQKVKELFDILTPQYPEYFESIIWKQASINDVDALGRAFEGVKYVYHCAAKVSLAEFHFDKLAKSNVEGTANVVNAAIKNKVKKFAYVSSIAAISAETQVKTIDETHSWNHSKDHTGYAHSKYGAELEVWRASQEGLDVVIVNPGVILGSFFWKRSSGMLIQRIANGLNFYPTGAVSVVGLSDVIKVLIQLMESSIKNERFILVSDNLSQKELTQKIARHLSKKPPVYPLSKGLLGFLFIIEKTISLFGLRKNFISIPLIESLCNTQKYEGSKITEYLDFQYSKLDDVLKKIGQDYKTI